MKAVLQIAIAICLLTGHTFAQRKHEPRFEDYPAAKRFSGKPVRVNLQSHPQARKFRTMLREGAREGVNFAGHYTVIVWGCGSECRTVAIVDALTGKVYFLPFEVSYGVEYRVDSDLLIVNPPSTLPKAYDSDFHEPIGTKTEYYRWKGNRLDFLYSKKAKK